MSQTNSESDPKRHPIQVVSRRLGLSVDVLRVWEKRYKLITPARTDGGHRLYSDSDIERLRLVREAMAGGRRVGGLAKLSDQELSALVEEDRQQAVSTLTTGSIAAINGKPETLVAECLEAVETLDSLTLKKVIDRAVIALPPEDFLDRVATPLMHRIGDLWQEGRLSPAHEHLASSVVRNRLAEVTAALQPPSSGRKMVVSTPSGQRHEIGAVFVAATAELEGWEVTYVGPDLPSADIARAVEQADADVVALSITVNPPNGDLVDELRLLRRLLAKDVVILVGGQAAHDIRTDLKSVGAKYMPDLADVREALRALVVSSNNGNN